MEYEECYCRNFLPLFTRVRGRSILGSTLGEGHRTLRWAATPTANRRHYGEDIDEGRNEDQPIPIGHLLRGVE